MKKETEEFMARLEQLENLTLAEQYQLKRELDECANTPHAKIHELITKKRRECYYFLLRQNWLSKIFKRWYRLHRANELAFHVFLKQEFNSPTYHRWCRFSNRLNRLTRGNNPWHEGG